MWKIDIQDLQQWAHFDNAADQGMVPPRWGRILVAVLGSLLVITAATVIVLEWNKGTLRIESDADIAVRVMRDEQPYKRLQVTAGATSIRIARRHVQTACASTPPIVQW